MSLASGGDRVTVMDPSPDRLTALAQHPGLDGVVTSESLMEDMSAVGMNHVDAFLALSDDDNRNAMAAQVASHIFHVRDVICRIGDPEREKFYQGLGINVFCPTVVSVDAVKQILKGSAAQRGTP